MSHWPPPSLLVLMHLSWEYVVICGGVWYLLAVWISASILKSSDIMDIDMTLAWERCCVIQ